jgi:excisionase family DNA binding protein
MPEVTRPGQTWLSLAAAAARLNVHAATLRRWADDGQVPYLRTPGGHRRFAAADLDRFAEERRVTQSQLPLPEAWAARALTRTRRDIPEQSGMHWLATMDEHRREQHRALGQRLMGLTLQYVSADHGEHWLDEARAIGRDYGRLCQSSAMPLTDALQATLFFRDKLLEATLDLPESARVRPGDSARLVKRINTLLNAVQLAIAEMYEASPASQPAQRGKRS